MEHWIECPPQPTRLLLAWQPPHEISDRVRWAVGEIKAQDGQIMFRYFNDDELGVYNSGRGVDQLRSYGFVGYPAFDFRHSDEIFREEVIPAFLRRLPSRNRTDFRNYLKHFRLRADQEMSDLSLLSVTGAKLPSDGFSLVDPLDPQSEGCDLILEVAGHRHYASMRSGLILGAPLTLMPEPSNDFDRMAVRIEAAGQLIGYVNRLQSRSISAWLSTRHVSCWLDRLNGGTSASKAWAFVRMRRHDDMLAA